ncbi:hypothetical protein, partial [Paenibacillus sp. CCS19]|uniref:hypothetical protein n=1 Tax=Paenibacillus sp. CCS19 TaxID=3158387 RepID=UPI00295F4022
YTNPFMGFFVFSCRNSYYNPSLGIVYPWVLSSFSRSLRNLLGVLWDKLEVFAAFVPLDCDW